MRVKMVLCVVSAAFLFAGCSKDNPASIGGVTPPAGMKQISGGTFMMGDLYPLPFPAQPVYSVTVSSFFMDSTEVTQADYYSLMAVNSSSHLGDSLPVDEVTWYDAVLYCNARSNRDSLDTVYSYTSITGTAGNGCSLVGYAIDYTKNGYRLPTEAEWEYACRAGTTTDYYWGGSYPLTTLADTLAMDSNAIWNHNSPAATSLVAGKKPNGFGLYDMSGNVFEWCNDWHAVEYDTTVHINPAGPATGTMRILRGGSYFNSFVFHRSSSRTRWVPTSHANGGLRCVRPL